MAWFQAGYVTGPLGGSPSGKAPDFDSGTRWFDSITPCQLQKFCLEVVVVLDYNNVYID